MRRGTKTAFEREWSAMVKSEERFLRRFSEEKPSFLDQKIEKFIPEKLRGVLNTAFCKAFELVFEKGTGVIEKTYRREDREYQFQVNSYAVGLRESKKNVKAFSKQAGHSKVQNIVTSGASGIGLGVLGIGLPDIPLFIGLVLKSVYEIALSYGFSYDSCEEQCFILRLIRAALQSGGAAREQNELLNRWITEDTSRSAGNTEPARADAKDGKVIKKGGGSAEMRAQIRLTSDVLSEKLLYMKFLQGIPVAGVIGGAFDAVYLKRISDYADLKYKRRFLEKRSLETSKD